ncbi:hypothetical protein [Rhizosphaericola mali]|uniref:Uncharacterized protein n=1 Tax=Rhizosphaericola mali TaxID=2545455 RepID=A0A5P2G172_9BACT|nr:hypothetical protein [Rhizosphaericola mali]QES88927.1 hypothetical protein E0W69_009745 [Rhizosphaericola mali]
MARIKQMNNTTNLTKLVSKKMPVKEKWEQCKKHIAIKLNGKTKHWDPKQQKQFLMFFCTSFIGLLILSFYFLTTQQYEGKPVTVPTLPKKILLPEQQLLKTLRPPNPKIVLPPLVDSGKYQQ